MTLQTTCMNWTIAQFLILEDRFIDIFDVQAVDEHLVESGTVRFLAKTTRNGKYYFLLSYPQGSTVKRGKSTIVPIDKSNLELRFEVRLPDGVTSFSTYRLVRFVDATEADNLETSLREFVPQGVKIRK